MTERMVTIEKNTVSLPKELYEAMGGPKKIRVVPMPYPAIAHIQKFSFKNRLYHTLSTLKRKLLGMKRNDTPKIIYFKKTGNNRVAYTNNISFNFKHKKIHIVNYHPEYVLISPDDLSESESREKSWQVIKDYHEHLKASLQDENANKVSRWLAREVFKKLKGKTFLELGCGAGRNLLFLHQNIKGIKTTGIDINPTAIKVAKKQLEKFDSKLLRKSVYDLTSFEDRSFDVVFTCGVLMHIPHEKVSQVVKEMYRIAKIAVVHFELDGPSHNFDYHRYPRDYKKLYRDIKLKGKFTYEIFPPGDFRSKVAPPFAHSLLISKQK